MSHLSPTTHHFPPPGLEGRYCDEVSGTITQIVSHRAQKSGPTRAFLQITPFSSRSERSPDLQNSSFTNPAPVVPADFDFSSAPPAGPLPPVGEKQATPQSMPTHATAHSPAVSRDWGVALISSTAPVVPPCSPPHAPFRAHCTAGSRQHRRLHGPSNRPGRLRLETGRSC